MNAHADVNHDPATDFIRSMDAAERLDHLLQTVESGPHWWSGINYAWLATISNHDWQDMHHRDELMSFVSTQFNAVTEWMREVDRLVQRIEQVRGEEMRDRAAGLGS